MLCTTGILLRMLTQGDGLEGVTHVLCDEAHERDKFSDFLLILLRELLPRRPQLRVVLMSATLHSELFAAYFGKCPVLSVGASPTSKLKDIVERQERKCTACSAAIMELPWNSSERTQCKTLLCTCRYHNSTIRLVDRSFNYNALRHS